MKIREEQRALENKMKEKVAEENFKQRIALRDQSDASSKAIQQANTVTTLAQKQPGAFGVLNKPGIMNALMTAAESNSRFGFFSINIPELRKMILQAGGTQDQLNAMSQLEFLAIQQQLQIAATQKGSISNFERQLFEKATFSPNDNPNVLIYKANVLRAKALFDRDIWKAYREFEKVNPRGTIEDFKETGQFKDLEKTYSNRVNQIDRVFIR